MVYMHTIHVRNVRGFCGGAVEQESGRGRGGEGGKRRTNLEREKIIIKIASELWNKTR
jgi:hypothetical protein